VSPIGASGVVVVPLANAVRRSDWDWLSRFQPAAALCGTTITTTRRQRIKTIAMTTLQKL